jgi:hypothetical protein
MVWANGAKLRAAHAASPEGPGAFMAEATTLRLLALRQRIGESVSAELAPRGFHFDAKRQMWVRPRSAAVHDAVGVPIDLQFSGESLFVTANLSVYSPELLARLGDRRSHAVRMHLASLTRNIGQIAPGGNWRQWEIADDVARDWTLGAFLTLLADVGLSWQEQFDDLEALRDGFIQFGHQDHADWTLPVLQEMINEQHTSDLNRREDHFEPITARPMRSRRRAQHTVRSAEPLWLCDD